MAVIICDVSLEVDSTPVTGEIELDTNSKKTITRINSLPSPVDSAYLKDVVIVFDSVAEFFIKHNDLKNVKVDKKI